MQRRAAAVYFVLFVVVSAGAYGFLGIMSEPAVQLDGPAYDAGEQFTVDGVSYTVENATSGGGELTFTNESAGETETLEIEEGGNVTLGQTQHFAHFRPDGTVQILPTDEFYGAYQAELAVQDTYDERRAGVWAVVILSFLAGIILLSAAYMPVRG